MTILGLWFFTAGYAAYAKLTIPTLQIEKVVKAYAGTIGCLKELERQNIVMYSIDGKELPYRIKITTRKNLVSA